jgi:hypothetical protein
MDESHGHRAAGDVARPIVIDRGLLYFADAHEAVRVRLEAVSAPGRRGFALACAERLMRRHEALPAVLQRPFTVSWRPVLDAMWDGLAGTRNAADEVVRPALEAFYAGPFNHDDGQNGPDDADEDAAAAAIYAAECFVTGDPVAAFNAAVRGSDAVGRTVSDLLDDEAGPVLTPKESNQRFADELSHPIAQAELAWQLATLAMVEHSPFDDRLSTRLRDQVGRG